jgi:hypothetical protein
MKIPNGLKGIFFKVGKWGKLNIPININCFIASHPQKNMAD